MQEQLDIKGSLRLVLRDRQGNMLREVCAGNQIVYGGRKFVAERFYKNISAPTWEFAVGTGSNPTKGHIEKLEKIVPGPDPKWPINMNQITQTDVDDPNGASLKRVKLTLPGMLNYDDADGYQLTEAALFNGETMYNRVIFTAIEKTKAFQLHFYWEILF